MIGGGEVFREHSCLADRRHEVCIANPTRQDVDVDVVRNAGARSVTEIHANIEPCGFIGFAEGGLTALRQIHHLVGSFLGGSVQFTEMFVRNNQQMTADVGIKIENDEIVLGPVENEISFVLLRVGSEDYKKRSPQIADWERRRKRCIRNARDSTACPILNPLWPSCIPT